MKNILRKSLTFLILFSLILSINSISKAEEGINIDTSLIQPRSTDEESEINPISMDEIEGTDEDIDEGINAESENVEELGYLNDNYYSFSSKDITIDESIYGDAFIITSGNVTVNASIYGSLFVIANEVTVSENAEIISSVFSLSKNLTLNGIIDTNLYTVATNTVTLGENSNITCDLYGTCQELIINGTVSRSVFSSSSKISVADTASILGNLNYTASEEITAPRTVIAGDINYKKNDSSNTEKQGVSIADIILNIISYILLVIILYMIYKLLKLKFIKNPNYIKDNLVKSILLGLAGLILTPIVCAILLVIGAILLTEILSGITIVLFTVLLLLYIILLMLSVSTAIISLSHLIADKCKEKINSNLTVTTILFIALLSIIYRLLLLVPIAGLIISVIFAIVGLGIWLTVLLPSKE